MALRLEALRGAGLIRYLSDVARLRISVFRAWPYLYDGDVAYEEAYLGAFVSAPGAIVVGAFDAGELVGASTAAPLAGEPAFATTPFTARGLPLTEYFYFGESVLVSRYRGQGIGVAFFAAREAVAADTPGVRACTFCAVVRDADDCRRPQDYRPLDDFWRRRGYGIWPGMTTHISWREVGAQAETNQPMQFWRKDIRP